MKKQDRPIIWLANEEWDPSAAICSYHITRTLSQTTEVLYCNSIGIRKPTATANDFRKIYSKLAKFFIGTKSINEHLSVLTPFGFPASIGKWTSSANSNIVVPQIKKAMSDLGEDFHNAIIWVSFPGWAPVVEKLDLPQDQIVLHFFDRWESYGGVDSSYIIELRNRLLHNAGVVLSSGQELASELANIHNHSYFAPHGFVKEIFMEPSGELPNDMQGIPHPIAGFFGTIDSFWIDFELLEHCVGANPHISWVFLGVTGFLSESDNKIFTKIMEQPNFFYLGAKRHSELPSYGNQFDVGLLPFKKSDLTRSASPLKLHEYLALGLPVVSTLMQQYGELEKFVTVASSPLHYGEIVNEVTNSEAPDRAERKKSVEKFGWDAMVEEYIRLATSAGIDFQYESSE